MTPVIDMLAAACFIGLCSAAWLRWLYVGTVRQWLVAAFFPRRWLGKQGRRELSGMSGISFDEWLIFESTCPAFLRKLLGCATCMAFHVSFWLCLVSLPELPTNVCGFAFRVFASAGIGLHLHAKTTTKAA